MLLHDLLLPYAKFLQQNEWVIVFEQLALHLLAEYGFSRVDSSQRSISEQYSAIVAEMAILMEVTILTNREVPSLPEGMKILVGNSLAASSHTGNAVNYDQFLAAHKPLSQEPGLSRSDADAGQDYASYSDAVIEKIVPLHVLTWVVVERNGHFCPFDSLDFSKTHQDLGQVFHAVFLYQRYAKELLTQLFNAHVAPKIYEILSQIWIDNHGLLCREPTQDELYLMADELISYMAYGSDPKSKFFTARGPRSNPTDHSHTIIPQFRRRIIRLVTGRDDTTAMDEVERQRYFQILDRINTISPQFGQLLGLKRADLSPTEQIKMIDASGQAQAQLLLQESSPVLRDLRDKLTGTFPNNHIQLETSTIASAAEEIQAKQMNVLKITAQGLQSWQVVSTIMPILAKYDSIKRQIADLYFKFLSTDSTEEIRDYLDSLGLTAITDWVLSVLPTRPMVEQYGSESQKQKQALREARIRLTNIIRSDYNCQSLFDPDDLENSTSIEDLAAQIVAENSNDFSHLTESDLRKLCKKILKAERYMIRHKKDDPLSQIHRLVGFATEGLSKVENKTNFLLPLGLVISTQDYTTAKGVNESIVKITFSGNDAAGLEKIWGIVPRRG